MGFMSFKREGLGWLRMSTMEEWGDSCLEQREHEKVSR